MSSFQFQARVQRALSQRIYVVGLDRLTTHKVLLEVMGNTDTVYLIGMQNPNIRPECTCGDFQSRSEWVPCKHIIYVYVRVLGNVASELEEMWEMGRNSVVWTRIFDQICNLRAVKDDKKEAQTENIRGDDVCCICYDDLSVGLTRACSSCLHTLHRACVEKWLKHNKTCPFCRSNAIAETHTEYEHKPGELKLVRKEII